jgi:hypothetical protein
LDGAKHQKYDKSLENRISMYDNQEYKRDSDLCNQDKIKLVSGNMIKYYTFQMNTSKPYVIQTQDDLVKEKIAKLQHEMERKAAMQMEETEQAEEELSVQTEEE